MKLNLEKVTLKDLKGEVVGEMNGRAQIANGLYTSGGKNNLACLDLSKKMYNGNEETEYSREELSVIREFVYAHFVPIAIDAIVSILNEAETKN